MRQRTVNTTLSAFAVVLSLITAAYAQPSRSQKEQNKPERPLPEWIRRDIENEKREQQRQSQPERRERPMPEWIRRDIENEKREQQRANPERPERPLPEWIRRDVENEKRQERRERERPDPSRWTWPDRNGGGGSDYVQDRLARERLRREMNSRARSAAPVPHELPDGGYGETAPGSTTGLNRAEKWLYARHPGLIEPVARAKSLAERETRHRFGISGRNDPSDAFRHAYWAALLARYVGPEWATRITDAHEMTAEPTPDPRGRDMDFYNNRVGIGIGYRYARLPEERLADIIEQGIREGAFVYIRR